MRHKDLFTCIAALLLGEAAVAQEAQLRQGDASYDRFSYVEAIEHYELAFQQGAQSITHARRLADSYWNLRRAAAAEPWYARVASSAEALPEDLYRYAEVLRMNAKYAESDEWLMRFAAAAPNDSRAHFKADSQHRLAALLASDGFTHRLIPASFNSDRADHSPFIGSGQLYFASARSNEFTARHHTWDDQPFLDVYSATIGAQHMVKDVRPLDGINTREHESNVIVSKDGSEMYFTRNNEDDADVMSGTNTTSNVDIFVRQRTPEGWGKEVRFARNHPGRSTGHPALSADGQRLYFTSDRPGGIGGKDLYYCEREGRGNWGEPVNLGPSINTEGDEMFPFVHDSVLYFSSDGHLGLGGLDVFSAVIVGSSFADVRNLNAPLNSVWDDHGFCLDPSGEWGYVVSDRPGGQGGDDVYSFIAHSLAEDERRWEGRVVDAKDHLPVPHLPVRLVDLQRNELARTVTNLDGRYTFDAPDVPASVVAQIPGGDGAELIPEEITISVYGNTELQDIELESVMDLPVNAVIRDADSEAPLSDVRVTVTDLRDGKVLFSALTDKNGIAQGQIPDRRFGEDVRLNVRFERDGYIERSEDVDIRVLTFLEQALSGEKGMQMNAVALGLDVGKAMNLHPIYFALGSAEIGPEAAQELARVARVMRANPGMRLDLRSHTDSRASAEHNQQLSQRRAAASRQHLIGLGIATARLTAHGFGESQLVNRCADGVECTEEEHQLNRRTEFIVISLNEVTQVPGR